MNPNNNVPLRTPDSKQSEKILNLPNILSASRIVFLPLLYYFCLTDQKTAFLISYILIVSTDAFDGYFARKLNQVTYFGQNLDFIADLLLSLSLIYFMYKLYPVLLIFNFNLILVVIGTMCLGLIYAWIRFGKPLFVHNELLRKGAVMTYFSVIIAYLYPDSIYFLTLTLCVIFIGFVEWLIMFIFFGEVDQDTRSIFLLLRKTDNTLQ